MTKSQLYRLGKSEVVSGLLTAIFAAVIISLAGVVSQPDFNIFEAPWGSILQRSLNAAFVTFVAFLSKSFLSDKNDKLFGSA